MTNKTNDLANTPSGFRDTALTLRPGDFPIGSTESRAAARMLLAQRRDTRRRIEIVTNVQFPWHGEDSAAENPANWPPGEPHASPWQDNGDTLMRFVYVPSDYEISK